jgi:hypothetical protein
VSIEKLIKKYEGELKHYLVGDMCSSAESSFCSRMCEQFLTDLHALTGTTPMHVEHARQEATRCQFCQENERFCCKHSAAKALVERPEPPTRGGPPCR